MSAAQQEIQVYESGPLDEYKASDEEGVVRTLRDKLMEAIKNGGSTKELTYFPTLQLCSTINTVVEKFSRYSPPPCQHRRKCARLTSVQEFTDEYREEQLSVDKECLQRFVEYTTSTNCAVKQFANDAFNALKNLSEDVIRHNMCMPKVSEFKDGDYRKILVASMVWLFQMRESMNKGGILLIQHMLHAWEAPAAERGGYSSGRSSDSTDDEEFDEGHTRAQRGRPKSLASLVQGKRKRLKTKPTKPSVPMQTSSDAVQVLDSAISRHNAQSYRTEAIEAAKKLRIGAKQRQTMLQFTKAERGRRSTKHATATELRRILTTCTEDALVVMLRAIGKVTKLGRGKEYKDFYVTLLGGLLIEPNDATDRCDRIIRAAGAFE